MCIELLHVGKFKSTVIVISGPVWIYTVPKIERRNNVWHAFAYAPFAVNDEILETPGAVLEGNKPGLNWLQSRILVFKLGDRSSCAISSGIHVRLRHKWQKGSCLFSLGQSSQLPMHGTT